MTDMYERQQRALAKAKQVLLEAEKTRSFKELEPLVERFHSGDSELLRQPLFVSNCGAYLHHLYLSGQRSEVLSLLILFEAYVDDHEREIRQNGVTILTKFSSLIVESNDLEVICSVFLLLTRWLEIEEEPIDISGVACSQLHKLAHRLLLDEKYWQETSILTTILKQILADQLKKDPGLKEMAAKLLESLATKEVLEKLMRGFLEERSEYKIHARNNLTSLGHRSTIFLVNSLMHSKEKDVRLRLVKLIPDTGASVVPILKECLSKKPPWFVIRNILFIFAELNDESSFEIVHPYLEHQDIRVQQQALSYLTKVGGNMLKERLASALKIVHPQLKIQIVMQIGQVGDDTNLTGVLLDILQPIDPDPDPVTVDLVTKACVALRSSAQKNVIDTLQELVRQRKSVSDPTDRITLAAQDTLSLIEPAYRHKTQQSFKVISGLRGEDTAETLQMSNPSVDRIERSVDEYLAQGDLERAGKKLFSDGVNAARNKDFPTAEILRDKLLEINPLALTEVIKLGEIIDEEKSSTINNNHIEVWGGLYEKMSTEEFNGLYYALRQESYSPGEVIVNAGDNDPRLYFVNSGSVTLSCQSGSKESFLKRLQPGEVIGVGPFFSVSVWTVTMSSQSETQVHVLSRQKFVELRKHHPELEKKLEAFCRKHDTVPELLKMSGADRRETARYAITVMVRNILLDPYGNVGKRSFRGELIDISKGGLCFSIKISSKKNARLLLGRQIITEITLTDGNILKCFGVIVGVQFFDKEINDFSVHVKFYRHLDQVDFKKVINLEI